MNVAIWDDTLTAQNAHHTDWFYEIHVCAFYCRDLEFISQYADLFTPYKLKSDVKNIIISNSKCGYKIAPFWHEYDPLLLTWINLSANMNK